MEPLIKKFLVDKWIVLIVLISIAWIYKVENEFKERMLIVDSGKIAWVICDQVGRFSASYEISIYGDSGERVLKVIRERCDDLIKIDREGGEVVVVYSSVGEYHRLLQLFHHGTALYDIDLVDYAEERSRRKWPFYLMPLFPLFFRLSSIRSSNRRISAL